MTAASYTEDLTDIATGDESTGWTTFSTNQQGSPSYQDADYPYIQGSYAVTQTCSKSKTVANLGYDYGSDTNPGTDDAIFVWQSFASAFAMDDYAGTTTGQAGMCILIGNSTSNFDIWEVGGQDVPPYPYGGFICHAVCPSVTADDVTNGPRTSEQVIGAQINLTAYPSKGEPHSVDVMRFGRGSAIFEFGDLSNGYASISGFAAQNDLQTNRWGLIQEVSGGYLWKGRMQFGSATNAVDFRDSGEIIFIQWTPKVTANFNTIEIINASSRVDMTGFQFICLDTTTASQGRWITTNNADVNLQSCTFIDMSTFTFDTNTSALECVWTRCGLITAAGADLTGSSVNESTVAADASAINWNVNTDPDGYLDDLTISEGANAHHAIEFGTTSPTSLTIRGLNVGSDFAATNAQNNSTFYVARTSGDVTINCVGCSGNMTYKSAGANVTIVSDPVTVQATCVAKDGTALQNVRVFVKASDGTGPFPFEDTVTIVNSGTTATVTHTAHGMATNDYVFIDGASHYQNNGVFQITVTNANTYTYTMGSAPGSSPTGTIESTFVALYGLSNASGIVTTSRVYSTDQPITGWARNTVSGSPYYQEGVITGSVDSADGLTATAVLVSDE